MFKNVNDSIDYSREVEKKLRPYALRADQISGCGEGEKVSFPASRMACITQRYDKINVSAKFGKGIITTPLRLLGSGGNKSTRRDIRIWGQ